ncbi:MAG: sigma-E factor negative regulatory protein [Betaproteobacteria bacterium]|nr:sigma-E factor negative regulatory protein [Betaproteobacteria bacterium]
MKEKLSAMLDGDVDDVTARVLFVRLKHDKAFRGEWDAYCLLGDLIRGYAPPELEGFTERVMFRLEREPTILIPSSRKDRDKAVRHSWRHRLLPLAASVMGVLAVAGVVAVLSNNGAPAPTVASVQAVETPVAVPAVSHSVRDGARHDYLVAHQALAGGPMPAVVQYVRTVSSVQPEE